MRKHSLRLTREITNPNPLQRIPTTPRESLQTFRCKLHIIWQHNISDMGISRSGHIRNSDARSWDEAIFFINPLNSFTPNACPSKRTSIISALTNVKHMTEESSAAQKEQGFRTICESTLDTELRSTLPTHRSFVADAVKLRQRTVCIDFPSFRIAFGSVENSMKSADVEFTPRRNERIFHLFGRRRSRIEMHGAHITVGHRVTLFKSINIASQYSNY